MIPIIIALLLHLSYNKDRLSKNTRVNTLIKLEIKWLGFALLSLTAIATLVAILMWMTKNVYFWFLLIGLLLACSGITFEFIKERQQKSEKLHLIQGLVNGAFVFTGVVSTYLFTDMFHISAVIASSAVGLVGHILVKRYSIAIYCGSFAGMTSAMLLNYWQMFIVGLICAIVFVITQPVFTGFGGKLGTIAFVSSVIALLIMGKAFIESDHQAPIWAMLLVGVVGAVATYFVQHHLKQTAVVASATTSLLFAVIALLFIEPYAPILTTLFFSATFVGMSNKVRMPNIFVALIAGVLVGFLYAICVPYLNGAGGKLGTLALISMTIIFGAQETIKHGVKLIKSSSM